MEIRVALTSAKRPPLNFSLAAKDALRKTAGTNLPVEIEALKLIADQPG